MKRRDFIALLGGAAAAWPLAARAQQAGKVPRIGFLGATSAFGLVGRIDGFRQGLRDRGYVEGTNILIDYRWADGNYGRLPDLALDLVRSKVDLIVTHTTPGALAAKQATTTIPIVVVIVGDPVASGVVASVARPGGNITGQSFFNPELRAKRIELLKEIVPGITQVAVLLNPDNPAIVPELRAMETTAQSLGIQLQPFRLRGPNEIVDAFEAVERGDAKAVETGDDTIFITNIGAIAPLATKGRLVSIGPKDLAQAGGLIGYGVDFFATYRSAAVFVDKILKGAKPRDLPIEQATKFEVVLNLKAAKTLGIEVPTSILLRANEVIQ
jgi:putative tryptophan/tyrosine transport system substrate-binding protein